MPTREKNSLNHSIKKLGIIAGGGALPAHLVDICRAQNITPFIIGFKGYTDHVTPNYWGRIGASAKIIQTLKSENITDLVMIGAIKRPNMIDLWPDWITFKFFMKAWMKSFGDDGLLQAARNELEIMGFKLHGVHQFLPDLLMPVGALGKKTPNAAQHMDIQMGIKAARNWGAQDKGQAVLVKNGEIIARESQRGTNAMIKKHGQDGAILVKMCKPQQDKDLDLPTIGPQTIQLCATKNMAGIVTQAQASLLIERNIVQDQADQAGLFVIGVELNE